LVVAAAFCASPLSSALPADIAAALDADDVCVDGASCALELAQLRASALPATNDPDYSHPAWLSSCSKIFLDLGSSSGVNVRMLYEPEKYGGAALLKPLEKAFGSPTERKAHAETSGICALGLEPNPSHGQRLKDLQEAYEARGWHTHFYPLAAWKGDGYMAFNTTAKHKGVDDPADAGAHLSMKSSQWPGEKELMVRTANLSAFVRSLPSPVNLAVMDIEGAEYEVLAQLMQRATLCHNFIEKTLVEPHDSGEITQWGKAESFAEGTHPRSFTAILERRDQVSHFKWCAPSEVTELIEFHDSSFSEDVDSNFSA
jgi:FkbM family methyltransferase